MHDLTERDETGTPTDSPKGLAFAIADLDFARGWADLHECKFLVRLDHGTDGEEYEEAIALFTGLRSHCRLIIWRNAEAVFVQPLIGCMQQYPSVSMALASIVALKPRVVLIDTTAAA
jgi:hypothetical protein